MAVVLTLLTFTRSLLGLVFIFLALAVSGLWPVILET